MQNIHDEFTIFNIAKESLTKKFLATVQNKDIPILERLELWEEYADKILPVGSWRSDMPDWIIEENEDWVNRHEVVHFTDLLEHLPEGRVQIHLFTGEVLGLDDKGVEMVEEIFETGLCGAKYDW